MPTFQQVMMAYGATPSITGLSFWGVGDRGTYSDNPPVTPVTADNTPVKTWVDQSGSGNNAFNAGVTTSFWPTLQTNESNGLSIIRWVSASLQAYQITDNANLALNADSTLFAVMKLNSTGSTQGIFSKDNAGSAGAYFFQVNNVGKPLLDRPFVEAGVAATNGLGTSAFRVVTCLVSGTTVSHFLDGAANGTDTLATGTSIAHPAVVGAFNYTATTFYLNADVEEILVFGTTALDTATRQAWEDYLGLRNGITITH